MISGTSSKTRVYSSSLRYLHLLYETFYFSWKKSREKQIIIILEHMEYGLGKPPIQQHSQNEGLKGFPDPKNVSYPEKVTVSEWGGVEPKEHGGFCQFFGFIFPKCGYFTFHVPSTRWDGSYRYKDKPRITKSSCKPRRYSRTTSLMVSTLKNIISQIGMKINIWNYHLDKRCTHGLSLSLTPRLVFTSIKRACFRLSTKIWWRCHIRRLLCS